MSRPQPQNSDLLKQAIQASGTTQAIITHLVDKCDQLELLNKNITNQNQTLQKENETLKANQPKPAEEKKK